MFSTLVACFNETTHNDVCIQLFITLCLQCSDCFDANCHTFHIKCTLLALNEFWVFLPTSLYFKYNYDMNRTFNPK